MVLKCCVVGCTTRQGQGIRLFSFPADPNRAMQWSRAITLALNTPFIQVTSHRVCALHFKAIDFRNYHKEHLTHYAIPSVFPNSIAWTNPTIQQPSAQSTSESSLISDGPSLLPGTTKIRTVPMCIIENTETPCRTQIRVKPIHEMKQKVPYVIEEESENECWLLKHEITYSNQITEPGQEDSEMDQGWGIGEEPESKCLQLEWEVIESDQEVEESVYEDSNVPLGLDVGFKLSTAANLHEIKKRQLNFSLEKYAESNFSTDANPAAPSQKIRLGIYKETPVDGFVSEFANRARKSIERKLEKPFQIYKPVSYKSDIDVLGVNYFIKVKVAERNYIHLRIIQNWNGNEALTDIQTGHSKNSKIEFSGGPTFWQIL